MMSELESKNINLLIDFDSTFIKEESIELLSSISLKNVPNRNAIINRISKITNDAMEGNISFAEALTDRVQLLRANKDHITTTINEIKNNITASFLNNKQFFKNNYKNCYIISGGFKEIIHPILKPFKISENNIFANEFIFDEENNIISVNKKNSLSSDKGKVKIAKQIKGKNIIIGDGYTDYEVKKYNAAKLFIQFSGNLNRKSLNSVADYIATDFDDIINYINNTII
tara:strand:- start:141 stop:827 length:687 start_codon:yes stop_codon:yes gene_type:complete